MDLKFSQNNNNQSNKKESVEQNEFTTLNSVVKLVRMKANAYDEIRVPDV